MPHYCAAVGCNSHSYRHKVSFHRFPAQTERRTAWIQAVKRQNPDGSSWTPGKSAVLCGLHFISGSPNSDPRHPDYIPSVFPCVPRSRDTGKKRLCALEERHCTELESIECDDSNGHVYHPTDHQTIPEQPSSEAVKSAPHSAVTKMDPSPSPTKDMLYTEITSLRQKRDELKVKVELSSKFYFGAGFIQDDDEKTNYYTGLTTWTLFLHLFSHLASIMELNQAHDSHHMDELFVTLVKLKLNTTFQDIAYMCGMSLRKVTYLFSKWLDAMYDNLSFLVHWPDRKNIFKTIPPTFRKLYPRLTGIMDCFEIFIEHPSVLKARAECYSNDTKHSTVKVFIVCSPRGSIIFISAVWGGRESDLDIIRQCGFISPRYHMPGDQLLADRAFTLQDEFAVQCGAELIFPNFTHGESQQILNVCLHIKRVIGNLRQKYAILSGTLPSNLVKRSEDDDLTTVDKIVHVCAALTNMSDSVVN